MNIPNFRSLAKGLPNKDGWSIKPETIFRCGMPTYSTLEDLAYLKQKQMQYVYDLRGQKEVTQSPSFKDDFFCVTHQNIIPENKQNEFHLIQTHTVEELEEVMIDLYQHHLAFSPGFPLVIQKIQRQTAESFLFHCSAGKDRTGVLGAVLMMILDFEEDVIIEEYLRLDRVSLTVLKNLILQHYQDSEPGRPTLSLAEQDKLEVFMTVKLSYIQGFLQAVKKKYPNFETYIADHFGVNAQAKKIFKEKYLIS